MTDITVMLRDHGDLPSTRERAILIIEGLRRDYDELADRWDYVRDHMLQDIDGEFHLGWDLNSVAEREEFVLEIDRKIAEQK